MDVTTALTWLSSVIPAQYACDFASIVAFLIAACALTMRFWKPPAAGSKWVIVYQIVSAVAQARGWNAPAYQPGRKAIMVPVDTSRVEAAAALDLPLDQTKPGK